MRKTIKLMLPILSVALLSMVAEVKAIPINGSIAFSDHYTLNGPLDTATEITSITDVEVSATEGDYSTIAVGETVSFSGVSASSPFTFSPSTPFSDFWEISSGGNTYSFDINSVSIVTQTSTILALEGSGTARIDDGSGTYDPTVGSWNLTLNANGGILNFSGGASVPDGGSSMLLLGGVLVGLVGIRRFIA